jgi:hypothetical protein
MFKKNKKHLQPALISSVQQLPGNQRSRLEQSWAGVFYREVFCRLREEPFAVLYSELPSRPNVPVNVLVGLEFLKAGMGWSDEELYDAFLYNIQVRYALGFDELGEGEFDLRTLYYFRQRLSQHMQNSGLNLLDQAFEQITDEQISTFELKTGKQRMDSTQVSSNIRQQGRLQLLVEILQRVQRMLSEADQQKYGEVLAPYLKGHPGHYIYRLKKEEIPEHILQAGRVMQGMLRELRSSYASEAGFQVLERVFGEHFRVLEEGVQAKPNGELGACSLQSPDDWEATIRECGHGLRQGYVANIAETCDEHNPFQVITKVQLAPNSTDDTKLLLEALPKLVQRTELEMLHTDGGFGGPTVDELLAEHHVGLIQTGIRGMHLSQERVHFSDFQFQLDEAGQPVQLTCPCGQDALVERGSQKKGFVGRFALSACESCPFRTARQCPVRFRKRKGFYGIYFMPAKMKVTLRRQQNQAFRKTKRNPRAAVEATIRAIKHPFRQGKLPVRGRFRMFSMMIGSAAMNNVRQIQRFLRSKARPSEAGFLFAPLLHCFWIPQSLRLAFFRP